MWALGTMVGLLVIGVGLRTFLNRGRRDPADGLSVSQGWIVSQRGNSDTTQ